MKIHPREERTKKAELAIRIAISEIVEKYELSDGEALRVVSDASHDWIGTLAKYAIREERHPGEPEKCGGLDYSSERPPKRG